MFHKGKHDREKQLRFSIRKVSFGAASVAVAALFMFLGNGAVSAAEQGVSLTSEETKALQPKDQSVQNGTYEGNTIATSPAATVETNTQPSTVENSPSPESAPQKVETLDNKELVDLIKEIDGKFAKGTYATKTEESVNNLRDVLEEARTVLSNAKTKEELSQAQAKLVTATTKLQTQPEEKKEEPAVNTINRKSTVGVKASNTEKVADTNSIANSGSRDERNGKALDTNNPFRTDTTTTDTDPSANQTYTAPAENADLATLAKKLKDLPNYIENNKKIQDMDTLGNALNVEKGSVTEIKEFGGWKAVGENGKFAIARKTEAGVFPAYTVNINRTNQVWVREQSFDRSSEYILLLSKLVTKQNRTEPVYDNKPYLDNNEPGAQTARAAKWFDGIEKTFKAYATNEGTKVTVTFKTGYTGDNNGSKAKYKVEVFSIENGTEKSIYTAVVSPESDVNNSEMKVVAARDGNARNETFNASDLTKEKIEEKLALPENRPNATGGTFTSREIDLPKGVTSYKVRISLENKHQAGMSYNSTYLQYSLPITGLNFNVDQDTSAIAKGLLSRVYDKLKATETTDTDGKTDETKSAYLSELENIKTLVTSTDVKKTAEYKTALESILSKQLALKVDKTGLTDSKTLLDGLVNEDPTPGKTQDTATAYNVAKQEAIKAIEEAKTVIANEGATVAQVREALTTVNAKKTALQQAKDGLIVAATTEEKAKLKTDSDALKKVDTTGKTADSIKVYEAEFEKLKDQLEVAKNEAAAVLAKENNASKAEVQAAQAKVDAAKTALDKAAESLKDIDRDAAKKEIADAAKKATDAIEASTSLTQEQKAEEKAKVAKEAKDATDAIDNATTEEGINSAKENGKLAIEKETAITAINAEKAAKEQEIDNNTKLSDEEKSAAKAEVAKAAIEAVEAIKKADSKDAVDAAKAEGEKAIKAVNPIGKEKVLDAIQKAAEEKIAEIDKNDKLSAEEKATAKAEVAKAAIKAVEAIQNATTQDVVDAAKAEGETAIKAVNPVGKEKALEAIQTTTEAKLAEIDKNKNLSTEEKAAAKAEVAKAAIEAVEGIQKAEIQEAVNAAQAKGESAIKAVNPIGKEKALEAIQTAAEAKLAEIDKNTSLSDDEKAAAKAEVAKAAIEAVEAIQKATTQEAVNAAQAKGEAAIKAVNPVGKEKALAAIKVIKDAKLAEIDKNTTLSAEEKAAAKTAVEKAYNEAVEAIQKAATQEAVNDAEAKGEAAIKAVNPFGKKDVNEAKAAVEAAAAEKIASIKANPNLSAEEKAKAIVEVERLKQEALTAIDKARTKAELEKVLRTFLYQLDQKSLVYDRPTFNIEAYIQASITGVVKVEVGKAITQADIISKLNLPESVTVISVDLPDINTLGRTFAKVTLRLPDGTEVTVFVPVEVVESFKEDKQQNNTQEDSKPKVVPSNNSEQPTVTQTEDVKENPSNTSQESKASNQKVLPNTGTGNEISIFGSVAMTVLASLGLVATSKKKEEE